MLCLQCLAGWLVGMIVAAQRARKNGESLSDEWKRNTQLRLQKKKEEEDRNNNVRTECSFCFRVLSIRPEPSPSTSCLILCALLAFRLEWKWLGLDDALQILSTMRSMLARQEHEDCALKQQRREAALRYQHELDAQVQALRQRSIDSLTSE